MAKTASEIEKEVKEAKAKFNVVSKEEVSEENAFSDIETNYSELKIRGEINGDNIITFRTNITGKDLSLCKQRYEREKKKKAKTLAEFDDDYYLMLAERMTGIKYEAFNDLHVIDTLKVVDHVRNFLGE